MEDFVKFIFILFIVISFFRKFFKAPKPPETDNRKRPEPIKDNNAPVDYYPPRVESSSSSGGSGNEYEILKEIENLFKQPEEVQPVPADQRMRRIEQKTRIEEHSQRMDETKQSVSEQTIKVRKVDNTVTSSEHVITSFKREKPKLTIDKHSSDFSRNLISVDEHSSDFSRNLSGKEDVLSVFNLNLRDKLRHPQALKDYIIISEILGKPKAFD